MGKGRGKLLLYFHGILFIHEIPVEKAKEKGILRAEVEKDAAETKRQAKA